MTQEASKDPSAPAAPGTRPFHHPHDEFGAALFWVIANPRFDLLQAHDATFGGAGEFRKMAKVA